MTKNIRISDELLRLIKCVVDDFNKNIGSDPSEFYVEYYLHLYPHLEAIFSIGEFLGFKTEHKILEIGSGLGTRCLLGKAIWNASFTGLEPCANTYSNLQNAILEFKNINLSLPYTLIGRPGEDTGLPGGNFDFVLSSEVLEHVKDPEGVISEAYRVLKPQGKFFFSTCNYRSFYEGHYRCMWLPFLNRQTARLWVKCLRYNPKFLDEINFITRSKLSLYLKKAGFKNIRLGFAYPHPAPPEIKVDLPAGFDPIFRNKRNFFWGRAIQHPIAQKILRLFGMEYKIWGVAEKL